MSRNSHQLKRFFTFGLEARSESALKSTKKDRISKTFKLPQLPEKVAGWELKEVFLELKPETFERLSRTRQGMA